MILNLLALLKTFKRAQTIIVIVVVLTCLQASAKDKVALLYPEIDQPYKAIFDEIIKGINKTPNLDVNTLAVEKDADIKSIENWVNNEKAQTIIALGQQSFKTIQSFNLDLPLVIGAIINLPEKPNTKTIAISYAPHPKIVFNTLKKLASTINTVHVIYNPIEMGWLIEIAKKSAVEANIVLKTYEASNFKESAKIYRSILENMKSNQDAMWLLQDNSILDDRVLLPYILEKSWKDNLLIFSSNLSHVNKGALFSLYPDNYNLGIRMGNLAKTINETTSDETLLLPLEDVKLAVNIRTAKHLDLRINYRLRQEFDLIFPQR